MPRIFTIGYEGADIERFVLALQSAGVETLVDVRAVTVSRKRGFSKNGLSDRLGQAGIRYVHLRDLGDPKPGREAARAGLYEAFRAIYGQHLATDEAQDDLSILADLSAAQPTCLMCYERDPATCHRSIVARALPLSDVVVHDLYVDRSSPLNHATNRSGYDPRQGAAAGQ